MTGKAKKSSAPHRGGPLRDDAGRDHEIPAWAFPVACLLVTTLVFREFIFGTGMLAGPFSDTLSLGYAARSFFADSLEELGRVPGWAPDILGGVPFLESLSGGDALYPPSLILLLAIEPYRALGWKLVLHVLIAGLAMYGWLRSIDVSRAGALVGGLGFMLGPFFVSLVAPGHDGKMFVTALTPLLFWAVNSHFRAPRPRSFAGIALVVGAIVLTTHFQMAYFLFGATGGFAMFLALRRVRSTEPAGQGGRRVATTRFTTFLLASVVGLGISAVQFLPAVGYVTQDSRRVSTTREAAGETSKEWSASWSMHPEELASLVVPEFPGATGGASDWSRNSYWGRNAFKLNSEYVGLALLILATIGVAGATKTALRGFFVALGSVALLFALGANTPVWHVLYSILPGVSLFRAPSQVIFLTGFSVATLAGIGVDALMAAREDGEVWKRVRVVLIASVAGVGVLVLLISSGAIVELWTSAIYPQISADRLATFEGYVPMLTRGAGVAMLFTGATAAVAWGHRAGVLPPVLTVGALAILVTVDAARIDAPFVQVVDFQAWHTPHPLLSVIDEREQGADEPFRLLSLVDAGQDVAPAMHGMELVAGHHPNDLNRYRELIGMVGSGQPVNLLTADSPVRRLLNVRYIIWPDAQFGPPPPFPVVQRLAYPDGRPHSSLLAENGLPRARLVGRAVVLPEESVLPYLLAPGFDPSEEVVLSDAPTIELTGTVEGSVRWIERQPDRMKLSVVSDAPALLVIADNYYEGWVATVDGTDAPVLRAYHTLRAVPVDAGEHTVELRFHSSAVTRGLWISVLCTLLVLVLGVYDFARGRRGLKEVA